MNTSSAIWIVVLYCFGVRGQDLDKPEGSPCQWGHLNGTCVDARECKTLKEDVDQKKHPPICSFRGQLPIICCVKLRVSEDDTIPPPPPPPKLLANCGVVKYAESQTLIRDGESAARGEVPWHAGIYTKVTIPYKQICGGSLISNNIVISAAHCFWDEAQKQLPAENYAVGVGKLYRTWNTNLTKETHQRSDVKQILLPVRYQGSEANQQEDIAVVIVATAFQYTPFVQPVCVDFDVKLEKKQLRPGKYGKVAGWGLIGDNGLASQVLKVAKMPYVDTKTCINESPFTFRPFITSDKFCAGHKEGGIAVCKGDSGGGLSFAESDNGQTRYYLRGIVSAAPASNDVTSCNGNNYAGFTRLLKHEYFIKLSWGSEQREQETTAPKNTCEPVPPILTSAKTGRKAWDKCIEYQQKLVFPCTRMAPSGEFRRANRCYHYADILYDEEKEAVLNEFPHMALLGYNNTDLEKIDYLCGGSLISDKFVLTAGHCTVPENEYPLTYVLLGILKRSDPITDNNLFRIKQIYPHPEYVRKHKYNDIALLELEKTVYLDEFLVPACLHTGDNIDEGRAAATGWGAKYNWGPPSNEMKKMILKKFNTTECAKKFPPFRYMLNGLDPATQYCYENIRTSYDTCQGDSGGPLQVGNSKIACMHTIIGVTSFGQVCDLEGYPGLYTRVSHYVDWIESIVWP